MAEPQLYDAVIVGAGPFGLMLATLLVRWGYSVKHVDNRPEPTATGRADGIQPRTLDLLRNMGLKARLMSHHPARVYEVAFWDPAEPTDDASPPGIIRSGTWASCPRFIDARYPFTALLHLGYIERLFLDDMAAHGTTVQRPWTIDGFDVHKPAADGPSSSHPVEVHLKHVDGTPRETVRARYLFSGEGARSTVRDHLGIALRHKDPISYLWAVLDGIVHTDFPDIKLKCTIHSAHGSIMVIPRENNLVRLYIQIASSDDPDWNPSRTVAPEHVQEAAKRILQPYKIEWERVEWYSVYPIGQGIADHYTLDHRVFMGGDACHTHSPKAGQGMNTAFLDAQNLAWKIHLVEQGLANRSLLQTYEFERKQVAETLLAFDNKYAKLFSAKPPSAGTVAAAHGAGPASGPASDFVQTFKDNCAFTSGYGVVYQPSIITWSPQHPVQGPAVLVPPSADARLQPGRLLPNADATRVVDANVVHLEQEIPMNGAFRLFVFAGRRGPDTAAALADLAAALHRPGSLLRAAPAAFVACCVVFACTRPEVDILGDVPAALLAHSPTARDRVYADDRNDGGADTAAPAHAKMGLDPDRGGRAVIVVRPDGYVALTARLEAGTATADVLDAYFGGFCDGIGQKGQKGV